MHITALNATHAAPYRALMLHAYGHAADAFTSTPAEREAEPMSWWEDRLNHPQGAMLAFGAFDQTELIGTVAVEFSLKPKTQHKAMVVAMMVLDAWRGQGVARALLQAAIDHCKSRGDIRVVQLEVTHGNAPAQHLYQSLGFVPYGLEPMAVRTEHSFLAKQHLWLELPD
jgi:GNAT superfamily N-acetyltransferase